eukprot:scaffold5259_cov58-Attheya_sp.AAC.1
MEGAGMITDTNILPDDDAQFWVDVDLGPLSNDSVELPADGCLDKIDEDEGFVEDPDCLEGSALVRTKNELGYTVGYACDSEGIEELKTSSAVQTTAISVEFDYEMLLADASTDPAEAVRELEYWMLREVSEGVGLLGDGDACALSTTANSFTSALPQDSLSFGIIALDSQPADQLDIGSLLLPAHTIFHLYVYYIFRKEPCVIITNSPCVTMKGYMSGTITGTAEILAEERIKNFVRTRMWADDMLTDRISKLAFVGTRVDSLLGTRDPPPTALTNGAIFEPLTADKNNIISDYGVTFLVCFALGFVGIAGLLIWRRKSNNKKQGIAVYDYEDGDKCPTKMMELNEFQSTTCTSSTNIDINMDIDAERPDPKRKNGRTQRFLMRLKGSKKETSTQKTSTEIQRDLDTNQQQDEFLEDEESFSYGMKKEILGVHGGIVCSLVVGDNVNEDSDTDSWAQSEASQMTDLEMTLKPHSSEI